MEMKNTKRKILPKSFLVISVSCMAQKEGNTQFRGTKKYVSSLRRTCSLVRSCEHQRHPPGGCPGTGSLCNQRKAGIPVVYNDLTVMPEFLCMGAGHFCTEEQL